MGSEYEIFATGQQMKKVMEKECAPLMEKYGVRKVELDILYFLSHAGKHDTAKDITSTQHLSKAHISKSVDNLRSLGYIVSAEDQEDHRCCHIQLTPQAKPLIREFEEIRTRVYERLFAGVTEEERACMRTVIRKVLLNLDSEFTQAE